MNETMYLMGSEDVRQAGSSMREAAKEMQAAMGTLGFELHQQRLYMNDWLNRLESILQQNRVANVEAIRTKEGR